MRASASVLDPGGPAASEITGLTWILFVLGALVAIFFLALLAVALFRRDRGTPTPEPILERRWLATLGMAMPAAVILVVLGATLVAMRPSAQASADLRIEVIGHQWWWELRYPSFVTSNEIVIPAGEPVAFEVTSRDVIHSFWIPDLGGKMDMFPDYTNSIVLEADEPGVYTGACAEFCGLQHARMRLRVTALSRPEYDRWVDAQKSEASASPQDRGLEVFDSADCGRCHSIRGLAGGGDGPDLTHLASRQTLAAGTLDNTPENLARWIAAPQEVKEGVSMPDSDLSPEDLEALVAFLESLR